MSSPTPESEETRVTALSLFDIRTHEPICAATHAHCVAGLSEGFTRIFDVEADTLEPTDRDRKIDLKAHSTDPTILRVFVWPTDPAERPSQDDPWTPDSWKRFPCDFQPTW